MSGFAVNVDLTRYFDDLRKYASIFVDLKKCKVVGDVEKHIKLVFNLEDNICLINSKDFLIPRCEDVQILQHHHNEILKVQKCDFFDHQIHKNKQINATCDQNATALNLIHSERTIDLSCRPKQRIKISNCQNHYISAETSIYSPEITDTRRKHHSSYFCNTTDESQILVRGKHKHKRKKHNIQNEDGDLKLIDTDILDMSFKRPTIIKNPENCFSPYTTQESDMKLSSKMSDDPDDTIESHKKRKKKKYCLGDEDLANSWMPHNDSYSFNTKIHKKRRKLAKMNFEENVIENLSTDKNYQDETIENIHNSTVYEDNSVKRKHKKVKYHEEDFESSKKMACTKQENLGFNESVSNTSGCNTWVSYDTKDNEVYIKNSKKSKKEAVPSSSNNNYMSDDDEDILIDCEKLFLGEGQYKTNCEGSKSLLDENVDEQHEYNKTEPVPGITEYENTSACRTNNKQEISQKPKRIRKHNKRKKKEKLQYMAAVGPLLDRLVPKKSPSLPHSEVAKHVFFTDDNVVEEKTVASTTNNIPDQVKPGSLAGKSDDSTEVSISQDVPSNKPTAWQDELLKLASCTSKPVIYSRVTPSCISQQSQSSLEPTSQNHSSLKHNEEVLVNGSIQNDIETNEKTKDQFNEISEKFSRCNGEIKVINCTVSDSDTVTNSIEIEKPSPKSKIDLERISLNNYPIIDKVALNDLILFKTLKMNGQEPGLSKTILARVKDTEQFPDKMSLEVIECCEEYAEFVNAISENGIDNGEGFMLQLRWVDILEPRLFYP